MIGFSEEVEAAPSAGKQQRSLCCPAIQGLVEVLMGRYRVAQMKLHGRAHLDKSLHSNGTVGAIGSEHSSDEEIAVTVVFAKLIDN